ncbi:hypothetical protein Tco_0515251 [Tanacetum coccineum]
MRRSPLGNHSMEALKTGETGSSSIAIKASASSKSRKSLSSKGVSVGDELETIGSKYGEGLLRLYVFLAVVLRNLCHHFSHSFPPPGGGIEVYRKKHHYEL